MFKGPVILAQDQTLSAELKAKKQDIESRIYPCSESLKIMNDSHRDLIINCPGNDLKENGCNLFLQAFNVSNMVYKIKKCDTLHTEILDFSKNGLRK